MKKAILHIGNHKTGSTVIQHTLAMNQQKLVQEKIVYTAFHPITKNHIELAYALLKEALEKEGQLNEYPALKKSVWNTNQILQNIFAVSGNIYIISFEGFFSETLRILHGLEITDIQRTADTKIEKTENYKKLEERCNRYIREQLSLRLREYVEEIVLVCYLRRQDLYIEAMYNEYIKEPWHDVKVLPEFKEFVEDGPVHLDYEKELDEWEKYFGKSEMIIRNYEKEFMPNGVLYDFLLQALQIPYEKIEQLEKVQREDMNIRLSRDALEVKKILFSKMPENGMHEIFKQYSIEHPEEKDYAYFSYIERIQLAKRYESGNQNIARKYLGRNPEPLFWNQDYLCEVYSGLTKEKIDSIMEWIILKLKIMSESE